MTDPTQDTANGVEVDRKRLVAALQRLSKVTPTRSAKPILQTVKMNTADGHLVMSATDAAVAMVDRIVCSGQLEPSAIPCRDLLARIKAVSVNALALRRDGDHLIIGTDRIEHRIQALDVSEFPVVPTQPRGEAWMIRGPVLREALCVALKGAAKDQTRYAINGVLFEAGDDGGRLVASDGRRLIVSKFDTAGPACCSTIMPRGLANLASRFIDGKRDSKVSVCVFRGTGDADQPLPARLFILAENWMLSAAESEGNFPKYEDVIPEPGSRFVVDKSEFLETLKAVAEGTDPENRGVRLDLSEHFVRISAKPTDSGESWGMLASEFAGGGDSRVITAFNPRFLIDAFKTIPEDSVVFDVRQNRRCSGNQVSGNPCLIYGLGSDRVRWVVMPVSLGICASRESLGSNFEAAAA